MLREPITKPLMICLIRGHMTMQIRHHLILKPECWSKSGLKTDDSLGGSDRQLNLAGAAVWFESVKESLTKSLNAAMVTFVFGLERSSSAEQYPTKINLMDDQVLTMITVSYKQEWRRIKIACTCLLTMNAQNSAPVLLSVWLTNYTRQWCSLHFLKHFHTNHILNNSGGTTDRQNRETCMRFKFRYRGQWFGRRSLLMELPGYVLFHDPGLQPASVIHTESSSSFFLSTLCRLP